MTIKDRLRKDINSFYKNDIKSILYSLETWIKVYKGDILEDIFKELKKEYENINRGSNG